MTLVRALVAAACSLLFPGVGHVVLREWVRALFFSGLFVSAIALSFSADQLAAMSSLEGTWTVVTEETSAVDRFVLASIALFTATDALFRGLGAIGRDATEGPTCPHCGRPLDTDLEFCHWCTTRLEPVEPDSTS